MLNLCEGAAPAYKRNAGSITRYFRCTTGPKKGKLAADPSSCGVRPNPKRVRHGKRVAKQKGAVRVRKTAVAKKQQISKRVTQLNQLLTQRQNNSNSNRINETVTFLEYLNISPLFDVITEQSYEHVIDALTDIYEYVVTLSEDDDITIDIYEDEICVTHFDNDDIIVNEYQISDI